MADELVSNEEMAKERPPGNSLALDELYSSPLDHSYDTNATLQLALFLMLLTFFLVLTANAQFDTARVGSVIGGVQSAFGFLDNGQGAEDGTRSDALMPVQRDGAAPASGVYASRIEAIFAPLSGRLQVNGASFDMIVDVDDLFIAGSAASRAEQGEILREIGALLAQEDKRHLVILVPEARAQRLDVRRAASVARLLIDGGAPATQIAVGVAREDRALMTFRFYQLAGRA